MQLTTDPASDYLIAPPDPPTAARLTRRVAGHDEHGQPVEIAVVEERPLTIFLNSREVVTAMTIGDYPDYLALGFLKNQGMLSGADDVVGGVDYDADIDTVVVRTASQTTYEEKLEKKTRTSGCAVGTVFGDMMEGGLEGLTLPATPVRSSWLYTLAHKINRTPPSLYLEAGAIHGTVLCQRDRPLVYMEDVGRHNAVDKVAGWMLAKGVDPADKILYTTGRLTSEMVIKTAQMGIPTLASRSGFTAWGGVEIAQEVGLTLIGRMKGQRFTCLSGENRLIRDMDPAHAPPREDKRHRRKGGARDETRDDPPRFLQRQRTGELELSGWPPKGRSMIQSTRQPLGIILAGGLATRMGGGDKTLLPLGQGTLLSSVVDRLEPQVSGIALNANGDPPARFDGALPVIADSVEGFAGPLAGVLAGLDWAATQGADWIVTAAGDTPFFPCDLVPRLMLAAEEAQAPPIALAATLDADRGPPMRQPTFGLWSVALRDDLRAALEAGTRKVVAFTQAHGAAQAVWSDQPFDPFFNVNTPADLERAETLLQGAAT